MGLLDFLFSGKKIKELSEENLELKQIASYNMEKIALGNLKVNLNQNIPLYPAINIHSQTKRYVGTDDIYSIVKKLAETAARIPLYGYLQKDLKSFNQLVRETKGYKNPLRYKALQTKALEDLPEDDPIAVLLESPDPSMSKFEFYVAAYSFLCVFGECFILKQRPDFGTMAGLPIELNLMFPQHVEVIPSETLPRKIVGYNYRINGQIIRANIPVEDVIHIKYFNPEATFLGQELRGLSPLIVLKKRMARLDSGMDISVAQMQNGGRRTIVYDKNDSGQSVGKDKDGKEITIAGKRKDNFYRFLNNSANAGAPFFAGGEMGAVDIGSHLSELGITDLANVDFKKLCNAYGVSDILFNSDSASTESNVAMMTKQLYTNVILPNVHRFRDALIRGLLPDFKDGVLLENDGEPVRIKGDGKLRFIDADISDITELHEDMGKRATWMAQAYWLTPNEKREMMNYDKYDDPLFDQPLLPTGVQVLTDLEMLPPLDTYLPN